MLASASLAVVMQSTARALPLPFSVSTALVMPPTVLALQRLVSAFTAREMRPTAPAFPPAVPASLASTMRRIATAPPSAASMEWLLEVPPLLAVGEMTLAAIPSSLPSPSVARVSAVSSPPHRSTSALLKPPTSINNQLSPHVPVEIGEGEGNADFREIEGGVRSGKNFPPEACAVSAVQGEKGGFCFCENISAQVRDR
jgi:hypothetical protein